VHCKQTRGTQVAASQPNSAVNAPARPVTSLACASAAPARSARYRER
jgi:hypothetical protein